VRRPKGLESGFTDTERQYRRTHRPERALATWLAAGVGASEGLESGFADTERQYRRTHETDGLRLARTRPVSPGTVTARESDRTRLASTARPRHRPSGTAQHATGMSDSWRSGPSGPAKV
jgi:hypothetical protein